MSGSAFSNETEIDLSWGQVTHMRISKLTIIGSDNGLSPDRRQAIIGTSTGILSIQTLGTNFSEMLGEIHIFSFKKIHLKMWYGKWRPFCLCINVLMPWSSVSLQIQQRRRRWLCSRTLFWQHLLRVWIRVLDQKWYRDLFIKRCALNLERDPGASLCVCSLVDVKPRVQCC